MRVGDVVLRRRRIRDVRRIVRERVGVRRRDGSCRIGVQRHLVLVPILIRQAIVQEQPAVAVLDRHSAVIALRNGRAGILAHGECRLLDRVRRRRDDIIVRSVGIDGSACTSVKELIVRSVGRIDLQRVVDRLRAFAVVLIGVLRC